VTYFLSAITLLLHGMLIITVNRAIDDAYHLLPQPFNFFREVTAQRTLVCASPLNSGHEPSWATLNLNFRVGLQFRRK